MDQQLVVDVLGDAATECGFAENDGLDAVHDKPNCIEHHAPTQLISPLRHRIRGL